MVFSIDGEPAQRLPLQSTDGKNWLLNIEVADEARHIRHAYEIVDASGCTVRTEGNSWRYFAFNHRSKVFFSDTWTLQSLDPIYHRTAFCQCIMLPRGGDALHLHALSSPCLLLLHALPPTEGLKWAVVGNTENWGAWDVRKARPLHRTDTYEWALPLSREDFEQGVEYKYVLIDPTQPESAQWEAGNNRSLRPTAYAADSSAVRQDEMPQIPLKRWKGAGCVIPVFSLRSKGSFGIGDFGDLCLLIRWAAETGLRAIQLLPINDTTRTGTWRDSYPYSGISVFALHPLYLDAREWGHSAAYQKHSAEAERLNALPELDYEGVFRLKTAFTLDLYHEIGATVLASPEFKTFCREQEGWLNDYAQFCAFRDAFGTADFRTWPELEGTNSVAAPTDWEEKATFYRFVQFLLDRQMRRAHAEAREAGVLLKGDIPIGISPDSVPAWKKPRLFHFDGQAGAPPDDFAVHGQNWGFPTYNWEEMAKDGYKWWRSRLKHMERYFDAYRIDHVLGFFRIWEVPSCHIYGLLGRFRPALPFSAAEISGFGFYGNVEKYCRPFITASRMAEITAQYAETAWTETYFEPADDGYTLREAYRTQREILRLLPDNAERRLLLDTVAEVLFIRDPECPDHFHPRVAAQQTHVFQTLSDGEREAFNRLHDNFFYERHNQFWADEAMKKIPAVTQSHDTQCPQTQLLPLEGEGMLPCAEDLGMVPASVKGVLERLQILSLEIQRMPKEFGVRFGNPAHNPYLSVATIATHDMPPLRLWWQEDRERTQAYWHEALHHSGYAPEEATPEVCEEIVCQHLHAPSMLCLLALQDLLAISPTLRYAHPEREQINVPANPDQYWQYRMHLTLEELIRDTGFSEKLRSLIERE